VYDPQAEELEKEYEDLSTLMKSEKIRELFDWMIRLRAKNQPLLLGSAEDCKSTTSRGSTGKR